MNAVGHEEILEKLFTPGDVAEHLGLCTRSIYDAIKAGDIKAVKLLGRRHLRIPQSELIRLTRVGRES
jgi:excisionase family DNA binding protein